MPDAMNPAQRAEMNLWHVASTAADDYRSTRLSAYVPPMSNSVYEVMRGNEVKALLFTRAEAHSVCRAMARAAADLS
jgi:hypothetical protein